MYLEYKEAALARADLYVWALAPCEQITEHKWAREERQSSLCAISSFLFTVGFNMAWGWLKMRERAFSFNQ